MTMYGAPDSSVPTSSTFAACSLRSFTAARASRRNRCDGLFVAERLVAHELDGDALIELLVASRDDDAHSAGAEHPLDAVLAGKEIALLDGDGGSLRHRPQKYHGQAAAASRRSPPS